MTSLLPPKDRLHLLFAHSTFDMKPIFDARGSGIMTTQVTSYEDLEAALPEADVLVVSGLWKDDLLPRAGKLKYVQSVSSGMNQYDAAAFAASRVG